MGGEAIADRLSAILRSTLLMKASAGRSRGGPGKYIAGGFFWVRSAHTDMPGPDLPIRPGLKGVSGSSLKTTRGGPEKKHKRVGGILWKTEVFRTRRDHLCLSYWGVKRITPEKGSLQALGWACLSDRRDATKQVACLRKVRGGGGGVL